MEGARVLQVPTKKENYALCTRVSLLCARAACCFVILFPRLQSVRLDSVSVFVSAFTCTFVSSARAFPRVCVYACLCVCASACPAIK